MSNTIPDDVMRAVDALLDEAIAAGHDVSTEQMMARAFLAERQRCADIARDRRKAWLDVAEARAAAFYPLPTAFQTERAGEAEFIADAILNPPSSRSSSPETTPDELAPSQASSGTHSDWITWNGGECPVDEDMMVVYRQRAGTTSRSPQKAAHLRWAHIGRLGDIIAYRIIPANLTQHEASL